MIDHVAASLSVLCVTTCVDVVCRLWLSWWLRWRLLPPEGDLYFTAKLQNYTAVEKDEAVLSCELSRASGEVTWFKGDAEVFPSKNIVIQSDGRKRLLLVKKVAKSDGASYSCDCVTDRTTADLAVEGNRCRVSRQDSGPRPPPIRRIEAPPTCLCLWRRSTAIQLTSFTRAND